MQGYPRQPRKCKDKNSDGSLLDLAFTLCFCLDLWIMTDSVVEIHCDGVASWRERSRWLVFLRIRLISYRLSTVSDAFLRIKPLDSLLIHLMRHSGVLNRLPLHRSRSRLGCSRASNGPQEGQVCWPVGELCWDRFLGEILLGFCILLAEI